MVTEAQIEAAAKAIFKFRCTHPDPEVLCREVWSMPQHGPTVTFYRENARVALEAAAQITG